MKYLTLYKNNRQYITSSLTRKHPNVSFLTEENIVKYQEEPDKLDQEILDSLVAVVICDGKTNDDSDRDTVKNLVDPDNPFVLTGFNWKLNSGYGKYEEDFTSWIQTNGVIASSDKVQNSVVGRFLYFNAVNKKDDIPSFKVNITLGQQSKLKYNYIKEDGTGTYIVYSESGIYTIPTSYFSKYTGGNAWFGFYQIEGTSIIEQIPSFQGALVTDGIDDMITSTKTAQEMLSGSNEITVVSMVHQITTPNNYNYTNIIRYDLNTQGLTNIVQKDLGVGKAGIYGYSANLSNSSISVINNILGDKSDYIVPDAYTSSNISAKYSVQGWVNKYNSHSEISSVAWYWTVISKKSLTTDQINQIIKYYNLDKYIVPDVYYNVKKQGITNKNHSDFSDKLIDYSGNNKDLQLYNFSWDDGSGIGKFNTNFQNGNIWTHFVHIDNVTSDSFTYSRNESSWVVFSNTEFTNIDVPSFKIKISGLLDGQTINYSHYTSLGVSEDYIMSSDGEYTLPSDIRTAKPSVSNTSGFRVNNKETDNEIIITILPEEPYALVLDGVDDYGKATELPIYKDYTFIIDRQIISIGETAGIVASKSESSTDTSKQGAFLFEYLGSPNYISSWSFYKDNGKVANTDFTRSISYQSKYNYNGVELSSGTSLDSDKLWLGIVRDNDSRFANIAVYSLMSFPYSMSEFLIERQLKMYNLGTLYPGMVEFRPIVSYDKDLISKLKYFYIPKYANWVSISPGDYLPNNAEISFTVDLRYPVDEVSSNLVFSNLENVRVVKSSGSGNSYDIRAYVTNKSPQKINITIDEYIRYENIVQPYPVLLRFNDENGNEVSWGGKFKVGSTITRIGSIADPESNLLNGLYSISGLSLNGKAVTSSTSIVEKQMVFTCTATYLLDDNEPKCILSPSRLRIPNSSYKILGYIPDISGHGNHGKINNSAYKLNSGVNGYLVDFTTLKDDGIKGIVRTDSKIYLDKSFNYNQGFWLGRTNNPSPAYKVKVSGIPETGMLTYTGGVWLNLVNGINELPARTNTEEEHGFVIQSPNLDWSNLVIEQIGEYEGAYCFDGVDDFVTIPTIVGGKQVLMKVNWQNKTGLLYDQRKNGSSIDAFAILNVNSNNSIAYNSRNTDGETYIDGILNKNIVCPQLYKITHSITIINQLANKEEVISPTIGSDTTHKVYFSQMSLYDFMLFDNISTDDKIKELNEYVGIEAKVELPPYYWDAYGKTNLDGDKATIQQRGVAVGDYDLTNTNFAYNKMSGYGGYNLGRFDKSWSSSANTSVKVVQRNPYSIILKKLGGSNDWEFNTTELQIISNPVSVKFKSDKNIRFACDYHYYTVGENTEGKPLGIAYKDLIANEDTIITISPISQENIDKYNIDVNRAYYLIYFQLSATLSVDEEVTIEMLPLYDGLVYDGVDDYSKNENIPVLTDYTIIAKRLWINKDNPLNEQFIHKGAINTPISESAFMLEYEIANDTYYRSSSYGGYINIERSNRPERIVYQTSNSYNGTSITKGSGTDTTGIVIGGVTNNYWNGVFYKLMLYSKTLPLLQINYLKNLMERDEIIDLNNSIFIK